MNYLRFPLMALLFLAFCNSSGDATADHYDSLEITGSGDVDVTSYASEYGEAKFDIFVTANHGEHDNVDIDVSFTDDWSGEVEVTDCNGGEVPTTLNESQPIFACIDVDIAESGSEIGDSIEMDVSVTSSQDGHGDSIIFKIQVSNWFVYSDDGVQSFVECGCNDSKNIYTIHLKNIKVDENGNPEDIQDPIEIELSSFVPGWHIDSDNSAWDKMQLKATINYIAAEGDFNLDLEVQLVMGIAPASSYVGSNTFIVFTVNDETIYTLLSLEAFVHDNFNLFVADAGDRSVDNGCPDTQVSASWDAVIKNFGNTMDSFSIAFDTSDADAAGWSVDGATGGNTGNLNPKFEHNEEDGTGMYTMNVGLHIPAGLPAGTSHGFTMTVTSDSDSSVTQTVSFTATITQCYGLTMTVDSASKFEEPGGTVDFIFSVTNTGNGEDTVSLATMGVWSPTLSQSWLTIASGATSTTLLSVTVPEDASANAASGSVMVHAYSEGCGDHTTDCDYAYDVSVSVTANQVYAITADYYNNNASMASVSVQEEMSVQMKFNVTNNGNGNDEITLSLNNAPVWVTLGQTTALIGPGQTMTLTVDVDAAGAVRDYTFQVTATSADGTTSSTTGDLTVTVTSRGDDSGSPTTEVVEGCMDSAAANYDEEANVNLVYTCVYAPVAVAGATTTVDEGTTVQFNGAGSDQDGSVVKYEWDFDNDGVFEYSSGEDGRTTNIYNDKGVYTAVLRVTDDSGLTSTDSRKIIVVDEEDDSGGQVDSLPGFSYLASISSMILITILRRR